MRGNYLLCVLAVFVFDGVSDGFSAMMNRSGHEKSINTAKNSVNQLSPVYGCTGCPGIAMIMVDPCNGSGVQEWENEFMAIASGCDGFAVSDLTIDLLGFGVNGDVGTSTCPFMSPTSTLMNMLNSSSPGCAGINYAGPGEIIPPGAIIVVFTDSMAGTNALDISDLCNTGKEIYILQSSCHRTQGAFANYIAPDCFLPPNYRTYSISVGMCSDDLTYDKCALGITDPPSDIAYVWDDGFGVINYTYLSNNCQPDFTQANFNTSCMAFDSNQMIASGVDCHGDTTGMVSSGVLGGIEPNVFDWDWDGMPGNEDFDGNGPHDDPEQLSMLPGGFYYLTVTDAQGCTIDTVIEVIEQPPINITLGSTDVLCHGDSDASAWVIHVDGVPEYYAWSNGSNGADVTSVSGIGAGWVYVTVTDVFSCENVDSVLINQPPQLTATATGDTLLCNGDTSGEIDLVVNGGTMPFHYDWDNDGTGDNDDPQDLMNLEAGVYSVTVTDVHGCTAITSAWIIGPDSPLSGMESYTGCTGDGYSVDVNGTTYDEVNPSGIETLVGSGGCDSVVTIALVFEICCTTESAMISDTICEGDTLIFGGELLTVAGAYVDTIPDAIGPGCDSIIYLDLDVLPAVEEQIAASICEDSAYLFNGLLLNTPGIYTEITPGTAPGGCDSVYILELHVNNIQVNNIVETICEGEDYIVDGMPYNMTGMYSITLTEGSANGCDSIIDLDLTVQSCCEPATAFLVEQICDGETFFVDGLPFSTSGIYQVVIPDGVGPGCDSTVTLDLSVAPDVTNIIIVSICQGDTYDLNGISYNSTGVYADTLVGQAAGGCDSILKLDLTVSDELITHLVEDICEGEMVVIGGMQYSETGTYSETIMSGTGCDSTINLDLTVHPVVLSVREEDLCEGQVITIADQTFSTTGLYEILFPGQSAYDCDSVLTLDLEIHPEPVTELDITVCQYECYQFNGEQYCTAGVYPLVFDDASQHGCDSMVILNLTVQPFAESEINVTICDTTCFVFRDIEFCEEGAHLFEVEGAAANGCDSLYFVSIGIDDCCATASSYLSVVICEGEQYELNGTLYDTTGVYTQTFDKGAGNGCDSVITLNLTVNDHVRYTINASICPGQTFSIGEETFDSGGTYTVIFDHASIGCDTVITLNLDIDQFSTEMLEPVICIGESFIANDVEYTVAGMYSDTLPGQAHGGCDSVIHINLVVHDAAKNDIKLNACEGDSVMFNGTWYFTSGAYSDTLNGSAVNGCDSIIRIDLNWYPLPAVEAGPDQLITCMNTTVILQGHTTEKDVLWYGPGITMANEKDLMPAVATPGWYVLEVTSTDGCSASDSVYVTIGPSVPVADAGPDTVLSCEFSSIQLQGVSSGSNLQYFWTGPGIHVGNANSSNPTVSVPGMYSLVTTDTVSGCSSVPDSARIADIANDINAQITSVGDINCFNTTVVLDAMVTAANTDIEYEWQNQSGEVIGTEFSVEIEIPGMYFFQVRDTVSGCTDVDSVVVWDRTVPPPANAGDDQELTCNTTEVFINPDDTISSPGLTYIWTGPAGGILTDSTSPGIIASLSGWYILTVLDTATGCESADSVFVVDNTSDPVAEAGADQYLTCADQIAILTGDWSAKETEIKHVWSGPGVSNDSSLTIETRDTGLYYFTVIDGTTGCESTDSVTVDSGEFLNGATFSLRDPVCVGDNSGRISVVEVVGGEEPYMYSLDGSQLTADSVFDNIESGTYRVVILDANGCEWQTEVVLAEGPEISIELGDDIILKRGEVYMMDPAIVPGADQIDSIVWSPSTGLSCITCPEPDFTALLPGRITATIYLGNSCVDSDSLQFIVDRHPEVWVPNVFTPNGDHINDKVFVYAGPGVQRVLAFEIYDRWGEKIFKTEMPHPPNAMSNGWDGTFRGEVMPPGVFVFKSIVELTDGTTTIITGDITLLR